MCLFSSISLGWGGGGVRVYVHTVQIGEDMCISECAKRGRGLYLSASLSHTVWIFCAGASSGWRGFRRMTTWMTWTTSSVVDSSRSPASTLHGTTSPAERLIHSRTLFNSGHHTDSPAERTLHRHQQWLGLNLQYEARSPAEWTLHGHQKWLGLNLQYETGSLAEWTMHRQWLSLNLQHETHRSAEWTMHRHWQWQFYLQHETCSPAEWTLHRHGQWHHFAYWMKPVHQLNEPCTDMDSDTISLTEWNLFTSWMNLAQT